MGQSSTRPFRVPRRMTASRRLAAILFGDVVGYSRLIGADENGTLDRLRSIRADVIDVILARHRGRVVSTRGDGILAEFVSVVDALACACDLQRQMAYRNTGLAPDSKIEYRIG